MLNILPRNTQKKAASAAYTAKGIVYHTVSDFQRAEDNYILALEANPNNGVAKKNLQQVQQVRRFHEQQAQQSLYAALQRRHRSKQFY